MGNYDAAEPLYASSIRSAHEHKFIHEEAIASELAGDFFFKQGRHSEAYALYMHSIKCFMEWGALAVATYAGKIGCRDKFWVQYLRTACEDSQCG